VLVLRSVDSLKAHFEVYIAAMLVLLLHAAGKGQAAKKKANKNYLCALKGEESKDRVAIHQMLRIILKLRILVLLPVSTMPYVVIVKNNS
jgi:hypothetical protein